MRVSRSVSRLWRPATVSLSVWLLLVAAGTGVLLWQQDRSRQAVALHEEWGAHACSPRTRGPHPGVRYTSEGLPSWSAIQSAIIGRALDGRLDTPWLPSGNSTNFPFGVSSA